MAPSLTVADGAAALRFYMAAFDAVETYRVEAPDGALVLRLSIGGAEFWISGGPATPDGINTQKQSEIPNPAGTQKTGVEAAKTADPPLGGNSIRMILTVPNPETLFHQAIEAGATAIFPVGSAHGWKLGRLADPFGLHWEIGHPL